MAGALAVIAILFSACASAPATNAPAKSSPAQVISAGVAITKADMSVLPKNLRGEYETLVEAIVDTNGRITHAKVLRAAHPLVTDLVLEKVLPAWRFHPALENGVPVESKVIVPVVINLSD